jgi:hypothetical protein
VCGRRHRDDDEKRGGDELPRVACLSGAIADLLVRVGGSNPYIALTVIFLGDVIATNIITNAAAAGPYGPSRRGRRV